MRCRGEPTAGPNANLGAAYKLPDEYTMVWDRPAELSANTAYAFHFRLLDAAENGLAQGRVVHPTVDDGRLDARAIDSYITEIYVAEHARGCHLELLNSAFRLVKFLYAYYVSGAGVVNCSPLGSPQGNRLVIGDHIVAAPLLHGPALSAGDEAIKTSMQVLDRSLMWLGRRFEGVPTTVPEMTGAVCDAVSWTLS